MGEGIAVGVRDGGIAGAAVGKYVGAGVWECVGRDVGLSGDAASQTRPVTAHRQASRQVAVRMAKRRQVSADGRLVVTG